MIKRIMYDLVNPIIPFPKDEWKRTHKYNFFQLISFHPLEIEIKEDLEDLTDRGEITNEEIYEILVKDENINDEEKIILVDDYKGTYEVESQNLKKFFVEEIYDYGFEEYFFILPKSKVILALNHDRKALRCDFSKTDFSRKYRSQFRVSRIEKFKSFNLIGNKYRYELCLQEQPISKYRIERISKELEEFGLTISNLEKENYPTQNYLMTKNQINEAAKILNKHLLKFYNQDKQKDKEYLKRVKF